MKSFGLLSVFRSMVVAISMLVGLLVGTAPSFAVNPDEMLDDPVLEERARDISAGLRCLVCQNQSIDDSDAPLARDLRLLVRERLVAGDSDAEARKFLVNRYGEFVLLKPSFSAKNIFLWAFGPLVLLFGLFAIFRLYRKNKQVDQTSKSKGKDHLSEEEEAKLKKILSQ